MIENFLWEVSKPDTRILLPYSLEEGCGKGAGCKFLLSMGLEEGVWRSGMGNRGGGMEDNKIYDLQR